MKYGLFFRIFMYVTVMSSDAFFRQNNAQIVPTVWISLLLKVKPLQGKNSIFSGSGRRRIKLIILYDLVVAFTFPTSNHEFKG